MKKLKAIARAVAKYTIGYVFAHWKEYAAGLATGLAAGTLSGCGGLAQSDHKTSTTVWAVGIPGVAILHDATVMPDNRGDTANRTTQHNKADVEVEF